MSAPRRYVAIVQDAQGYPAPGEPRDPAPPNGPAQPVIHSVVLAADYEALTAERDMLRAALADYETPEEIARRYER